MYKIAQNFPVIVKQPLSLISTNLLKITQGSLYFCTKVKLRENAHDFEAKESTSESRVPNKKESGKNNEENTPPVIYLSETPTSSYPIDDFQFHVNASNPNQSDPNVSNQIEPKSDVILLYGKNDDNYDNSFKENLSEKKSSNSVLHHTELSNNDVKNEAKIELNQESNKTETATKQNQLSSSEPIIIGDNRRNNEPKLENLFTESHSEPQNIDPQTERATLNTFPQLMRLEPFKTEILSSNAVKSNSDWKTQQFSEKLKAFTPPKDVHEKDNYNVLNQELRTETKQEKPFITSNKVLQFKKAQTIPKIRARNPFRVQNVVTFKGKSAPINPNITFSNSVIETIRENRLVSPTTGQSLYQKMASDPILKPKNINPKNSTGDSTQNIETKCNITSVSTKKDIKEAKIPSLFHSNPEINKVPKPTMPQNVDNFYKHLFTASSDKPTTAALSNKTATVATKPATVVASSRILANATPSSKIFTATITSPNKTTATVTPPSKIVTATIEPSKKTIPVEKPTPFVNPVDKTKNLIPPSKPISPESTSSQLKLNPPKTGIPSQDVTSQNIIKPSSSGGVQFQIPGRLLIAFTCKKCNTRNSKKITKHAYTKGVVIIRCDGCKNNHLIADNLNWFSDMGKKRNIEDIMAEKGEKVKKIDLPGGISEYLTDS